MSRLEDEVNLYLSEDMTESELENFHETLDELLEVDYRFPYDKGDEDLEDEYLHDSDLWKDYLGNDYYYY